MNIQPAERLEHFPVYLFDALDQQKEEQEAKGVDVIDLSVGDPDRPTPKYIVDTLREAALDPNNHHYPSFKGLPAFRKAVAQWYERQYGVDLDPNREIMSVIGSKGGMSGLPLALVNPGDAAPSARAMRNRLSARGAVSPLRVLKMVLALGLPPQSSASAW